MPEFVDSAVREIDDRLRTLKDEASRLQAARAALTGGRRQRGRPAGNGGVRTRAHSATRRNGRTPRPRGGNTRANQALELVREQPGITIPEIAKAMKIQPNYLYRVLPRLASAGEIQRTGQGWHANGSSTSAPARSARGRSRGRTAKPSATRALRTRRGTEPTAQPSGRTARGATRTSILAVLAGGEAMTAGQVAAKSGLGRATVSTTLSKLAKSGEIQKAQRGYRVTASR